MLGHEAQRRQRLPRNQEKRRARWPGSQDRREGKDGIKNLRGRAGLIDDGQWLALLQIRHRAGIAGRLVLARTLAGGIGCGRGFRRRTTAARRLNRRGAGRVGLGHVTVGVRRRSHPRQRATDRPCGEHEHRREPGACARTMAHRMTIVTAVGKAKGCGAR